MTKPVVISGDDAVASLLERLGGDDYAWLLRSKSADAIGISHLLDVRQQERRLVFSFTGSRETNSRLLRMPVCIASASCGIWNFIFETRTIDAICSGMSTGLLMLAPQKLLIVRA